MAKKAQNKKEGAVDYSELTSEELIAIITEKDAVIAEMSDALKGASNGVSKPTVEFGGNRYEVIAKSFQHNKKIVLAGNLGGDEELVKELVESGSGLLKLIEE